MESRVEYKFEPAFLKKSGLYNRLTHSLDFQQP